MLKHRIPFLVGHCRNAHLLAGLVDIVTIGGDLFCAVQDALGHKASSRRHSTERSRSDLASCSKPGLEFAGKGCGAFLGFAQALFVFARIERQLCKKIKNVQNLLASHFCEFCS